MRHVRYLFSVQFAPRSKRHTQTHLFLVRVKSYYFVAQADCVLPLTIFRLSL